MSQIAQSGSTTRKKKWPWWIRATGWVLGILLVLYTIVCFILAGQASRHPGGKEEYAHHWEATTKMKNLEWMLWLQKRSKGRYPSDEEGLPSLFPVKNANKHKSMEEEMEEVGGSDEVRKKLRDPWKRPFKYRFPGVHNKDGYDLYSLGPDGIEDTEDDIKNW